MTGPEAQYPVLSSGVQIMLGATYGQALHVTPICSELPALLSVELRLP